VGWMVVARGIWSLTTAAITFLLIADFGPTRELPCAGGGNICLLRIDPLLPPVAVIGVGVAAGCGVWWVSRPRGRTGTVAPIRLAAATAIVVANVMGAFLLAWAVGSTAARGLAVALVGLNLVVAGAARTPRGPRTAAASR
jgi:hypothetical protein